MSARFCLSLIALFLLSSGLLNAQVVTNPADGQPGSLRDLITSTPSGGTITFDSTLEGDTLRLPLGPLVIDKTLTLTGHVILSGNRQNRVLHVKPDGSLYLEDLVITKGLAPVTTATDGFSVTASGGGILNEGFLSLKRVQVSHNRAVTPTAGLFIPTHFAQGGGILNTGTLRIDATVLTHNTAVATGPDNRYACGGSLYNQAGSVTISMSHFSVDSVVAEGHTFSITARAAGGAVCNRDGHVDITSTVIADNVVSSTEARGGGLYTEGGRVDLSSTTFARNEVSARINGGTALAFGAGLYGESDAVVTLMNSTVSGNRAQAGSSAFDNGDITFSYAIGGGLYNDNGQFDLESTTVTMNLVIASSRNALAESDADGGGFYQFGSEARTTLFNTLIANNSVIIEPFEETTSLQAITQSLDLSGEGTFTSEGHNLIGTVNGTDAFTNSTNHDQVGISDPLLLPLADNGGPTPTHALHRNSPAVDAGSCPDLEYDQRGFGDNRLHHRTLGSQCDIGAFELETSLPVELTTFRATADNAKVMLTWATASETNNAGFEIQRRVATSTVGARYIVPLPADGDIWETASWVEGRGTTTEAHTYRYTASGLAPGIHQFRLKQLDFDGTTTFSETIEVLLEMPEAFTLSEGYPNPFNPQTTFTLNVAHDQHIQAVVFNAMGQRVATLFDAPATAHIPHRLSLNGADLPSGLYVVRVIGQSFKADRSVVLLK